MDWIMSHNEETQAKGATETQTETITATSDAPSNVEEPPAEAKSIKCDEYV